MRWSDLTLAVLVTVVQALLVISGLLRSVVAVRATELHGICRALMGVSGALALALGWLCSWESMRSLPAIGILVAVWWLMSGALDAMGVSLHGHRPRRRQGSGAPP